MSSREAVSGRMSLAAIVYHQYSTLPLAVSRSTCAGKTYIVTGANIGLGYECAKHLITFRSERVILAVRSKERGDEALASIEEATGVRGIGQVWIVDLLSYASVVDFCARVERELPRVDGLIENAATALADWRLFEGMESTLTTNVVSTFLMAVLLLPHLKACAARYGTKPVIGIVSSGLAFTREADVVKVDRSRIFDDLNDPKRWSMNGTERYSLSKLLEVVVVRELASLLPVDENGVIINLINPGLCSTGLLRHTDAKNKIMVGLLRIIIGRSAEWGSRNLLHSLEAGEVSHGKYLSYCEIREDHVPEWVSNDDGRKFGRKLWAELSAILDRAKPGCVDRALT
ncbi:Short-chain dehydrogenase [Geosmithia morbida]|uniref:Short-chain dehydrogenase n=1 Tax=Geosmithia morbida TaxID=1094350 RepID=A0A9P4YWX9_9HYPO|nr:Short-chain dehydrogenase [Geosmithia morbida]KAF4122549.1 Short-chain dehydrogenase [Geosmithia morbida]